MRLDLKNACPEESGDYVQVVFDTDDEAGPYLLVQCQFEDEDGGIFYVETSDDEYSGHVHIKRAILTRNTFTLELSRKDAARIEVTFTATRSNFAELQRVLQTMLPNLEFKPDLAG